MDFMEAIKRRHAVRSYEDRPIAADARHEMQELLSQLNLESGLSMQLVLNEPKAFSGFMAHYGKFSGVKNYIALIGKKGPGLDEDCGCYGEKAVLRAQLLGLNTCWAAMTYQKVPGALRIAPRGEAGCGNRPRLRHDPGRGPSGKAGRAALRGGWADAPVVPPGHGGGPAGPYRHEPAEVPFFAQGRRGVREAGERLLHQNGPGNRQMPL